MHRDKGSYEQARSAEQKVRLEQIRLVQREIAQLMLYGSQGFDTEAEVCTFDRIFAREQAALAELKRGMKRSSDVK